MGARAAAARAADGFARLGDLQSKAMLLRSRGKALEPLLPPEKEGTPISDRLRAPTPTPPRPEGTEGTVLVHPQNSSPGLAGLFWQPEVLCVSV